MSGTFPFFRSSQELHDGLVADVLWRKKHPPLTDVYYGDGSHSTTREHHDHSCVACSLVSECQRDFCPVYSQHVTSCYISTGLSCFQNRVVQARKNQ